MNPQKAPIHCENQGRLLKDCVCTARLRFEGSSELLLSRVRVRLDCRWIHQHQRGRRGRGGERKSKSTRAKAPATEGGRPQEIGSGQRKGGLGRKSSWRRQTKKEGEERNRRRRGSRRKMGIGRRERMTNHNTLNPSSYDFLLRKRP